jgi:hypothetical protein
MTSDARLKENRVPTASPPQATTRKEPTGHWKLSAAYVKPRSFHAPG